MSFRPFAKHVDVALKLHAQDDGLEDNENQPRENNGETERHCVPGHSYLAVDSGNDKACSPPGGASARPEDQHASDESYGRGGSKRRFRATKTWWERPEKDGRTENADGCPEDDADDGAPVHPLS